MRGSHAYKVERSHGFLAKNDTRVKEQVEANKNKLGHDAALRLAAEASRIITARGKKVVTFDMENAPPDQATLLKHLLGPAGNLRAPTLMRGKTLLVGFNADAYQALV